MKLKSRRVVVWVLAFGAVTALAVAATIDIGNGEAGRGLQIKKNFVASQPPGSGMMFTVPMIIQSDLPMIEFNHTSAPD